MLAGTINQNGAFTMTAQKVGKNTVLAQIIRMVQEAQGSKAPVQRIVDKVTAVLFLLSLLWLFYFPCLDSGRWSG